MDVNFYDKVKNAVEIELSERGMLSSNAAETVTHFAWNIAHQYARNELENNETRLQDFVRAFVQVWIKGYNEGYDMI